MNEKKKTALITGAAVGIGRAAAIKFAEKGYNLVLIDVNYDGLESVRKECSEADVMIEKCDISNESAVKEAVKKAYEKFGSVDVLVNNAALWRGFTPFISVSADVWKSFLEINVMGTVYMTQAVLEKMTENGWGRIINVASVAGVYGNANMVCYSATKGAVISMTKALAKETTEHGVTVNAVSPGSVSPAENSDINYTQKSELAFAGRTGSDAENAELILFLASDEAGYISGQNIQIDGCRKKM